MHHNKKVQKSCKQIDVGQDLVQFNGEPLQRSLEDTKALMLKDVLLTYLNSAHRMGLNGPQESQAYSLGVKIAGEKGKMLFDQEEYDLLKSICDRCGKINLENGQVSSLYGIVVTQQVKQIVDEAENWKEEKEAASK